MRCFTNSIILLSNFIDFAQQIHWFWSAISLILLYHHVEICAQKNCFTSQTKVVFLIKTNWFAIASATYLHETFVSQSIIPTFSSRSTIVYKQGNPQYFSTGPKSSPNNIIMYARAHMWNKKFIENYNYVMLARSIPSWFGGVYRVFLFCCCCIITINYRIVILCPSPDSDAREMGHV